MLSATSREGTAGAELHNTLDTPYNVQQLQSEFHALTPREAYRELCQRFQCRPISAVAAMFPNRIGRWSETTELSFTQSYVGPKGVRPIVELCKRLSALKSLDLANNYLTNDSVYFITRMAMHHPALERIELSGNEFISWTGGSYLAELVARNTNMKEVGVLGTALPQRVAEAVFEQTRRNCVLAFHASGRTPKPSIHPAVIHLRAMKRYFEEVQQNGTVPATALVDGLRERMRILGQERDFGAFTEDFFEQLRARAPEERITWEMFIVLLRLDGSEYDAVLIKKLQRVFLEFNMEPSAGMEGFIEARDLAAIHARLYGEPISSEEVEHLWSLISVDATMTLQWDEFLMIMYIRGPKETFDALSWTRTPLEGLKMQQQQQLKGLADKTEHSARGKKRNFGLMLLPPQCSLGGEIPSVGINSFSSLHCDPRGAVWAVNESGTRVFYFSRTMLADMISSSVTTSLQPFTPIFECNEADHILSVVFPTIGSGQQVFVCIATVQGCLVLCSADNPQVVLHQCELESQLSAVTAVLIGEGGETPKKEMAEAAPSVVVADATANGVSVLVSFIDENFSEVVLVEWGDDEDGVSATGLFRIRGRLQSIMVDEMCERIITVAQRGNVDVWNWRRGVDETLIFGMPAYDTDKYGEPSCCTLVCGERLWIGTTTGSIVVFHLLLPHTHTPSSLTNNMDVNGKAPRCLWQAHRDGSAVRSLLIMSLGRHMWSYGEDQQALVWDATQLTLRGSFQFPGSGFISLSSGERCAHTTLWAVNATAGTATWFVVKEPLMCDEQSCLLGRDECIVKRQDARRFYVLDMLVSHLCSVLQLDQHEESAEEEDDDGEGNDMNPPKSRSERGQRKRHHDRKDGAVSVGHTLSTPPHLDVALQQLHDDHPTMRLLPPAIASLVVGERMLQRALVEDGLYSMSFLEDLRQLLQLRRQDRELQSQVRRCLVGLNELLPPNESCESIDDVVDAARSLMQYGVASSSSVTSPIKMSMDQPLQVRLQRRSKSLEDSPPPSLCSHPTNINGATTTATTTTTTSDGGAASAAAVTRSGVLLPETIEAYNSQTRRLEEELAAERRRRQELEARFATAEDEHHEIQQQLTRAYRLQEEHESRTAALERALKAAKRAAAVPAAGATRLCELESSLLAANRTVEELQLKVEALTRGQQQAVQEHTSLQTLLHQYRMKEQLAKRAFSNFIETQNHILDKLEGILAHTPSNDRNCSHNDRSSSDATSTDVEALYDWLCVRIQHQRETHAGLRHSYMQQSEREEKEWETTPLSSAASVSCGN